MTLDEITIRLRAAGCVFAEDETALLVEAAGSAAELARLVESRVAGLPLEHLVGWAAFGGLRIAVGPGVFVPRRRSELLVHEALRTLGTSVADAPPVLVDLCCGSGAIGAAVRAKRPDVEVHATDVDPGVLPWVRTNLGPSGQVYAGDLFEPLPQRLRGRVAVVVANTPHVPTGDLRLLPPEARLHEPRVALHGGPDGLDLVRRIAAAAPDWLAPGGHLVTETGAHQTPAALVILRAAGLTAQVVQDPDLDATALVARSPLPHPPV